MPEISGALFNEGYLQKGWTRGLLRREYKKIIWRRMDRIWRREINGSVVRRETVLFFVWCLLKPRLHNTEITLYYVILLKRRLFAEPQSLKGEEARIAEEKNPSGVQEENLEKEGGNNLEEEGDERTDGEEGNCSLFCLVLT